MTSPAGAGSAAEGGGDGRSAGDVASGPPLSDVADDAVAWLRGFQAERGTSVAVVHHLGRSGARIVAIGPDGRFGDAVVESVAAAEQVCRRAGVELKSWDRETSGLVAITPADRKKMAGTGR